MKHDHGVLASEKPCGAVCRAGQQDGIGCAPDECDRENGTRPARVQTCPRCKQPAANLFRVTLPGDELETEHCGCLYTPGVGETFYQVPCTGVNHDTPPPSREKGEGEK